MQCELNLEKRCDERVIRRLKEIENSFADCNKAIKTNPILYLVFIKKMEGFNIGLTVINPGTVGIKKEFYMTKGHTHRKPSSELYILVEGRGKLIIQNKSAKIIGLKKNKAYVVPKNYAHRLVNTGNGKLKVLTVYSAEAGHNYNVQFKKRLFKNGPV